MSILVRAVRMGYYQHKRMREGNEFTLAKVEDFSHEWMECLDKDVKLPAKKMSSQEALEQLGQAADKKLKQARAQASAPVAQP